MASVTIYNSEGYEYTEDGPVGARNEFIQDLKFANVRLFAEQKQQLRVITFFRARESLTGRSELFLAEIRTSGNGRLMLQDLESKIDEVGLILDEDASDVIYEKLTRDLAGRTSVDVDGTTLNQLLRRGEQLSFGVPTQEDAVSLFQQYMRKNSVSSVAISEKASASVLSDVDVVIELGSYTTATPIGSTANLIEEERRKRRERRQKRAGGTASGGRGSTGASGPNELLRIGLLAFIALCVVVVGVIGAALVADVPYENRIPGIGPEFDVTAGGGTNLLQISGTVEEANETVTYVIEPKNGEGQVINQTVGPKRPPSLEQPLTDGNYTLKIRYEEGVVLTEQFEVTAFETVDSTISNDSLSVRQTVDHTPFELTANPPNRSETTTTLYVNGTERTSATGLFSENVSLEPGTYEVRMEVTGPTITSAKNVSVYTTVTVQPPSAADGQLDVDERRQSNVVSVSGNANVSEVVVRYTPSDNRTTGFTRTVTLAPDVSRFDETLFLPRGDGRLRVTLDGVERYNASTTDRLSKYIGPVSLGGAAFDGPNVTLEQSSVQLNGSVNAEYIGNVSVLIDGTQTQRVSVQNGSFETNLSLDGAGPHRLTLQGLNENGTAVFDLVTVVEVSQPSTEANESGGSGGATSTSTPSPTPAPSPTATPAPSPTPTAAPPTTPEQTVG